MFSLKRDNNTKEKDRAEIVKKGLENATAARKTLEDSTIIGAGFWVSFIFLMFYVAVSSAAVTHVDLLLQNKVKLPFLNVELPLVGFIFLAPILFIIMHMFTLSKLVMLAEKAKRFLQALEKVTESEARESLRQSLPSNIFVQFLAGPTEISQGPFGGLLRLMGWITMAIAPVFLLLFVQVQFLPYHSFWLNQEQRVLLLVDLNLIWWLWGRMLKTPMQESFPDTAPSVGSGELLEQNILAIWSRISYPLGFTASFAALFFSFYVATFPEEWGSPLLAFSPPLEKLRAALTDTVFGTKNSFSRWPYNTLQLEEFNIFETLNLEDHNKLGGRDFTIRLRERHLEGANLNLAKLGKADLRAANLQGAKLNGAELEGATLNDAQLQSAELIAAKLQGAKLFNTQLQAATLDRALLQGAQLNTANLQGAKLFNSHFQGASFNNAKLQSALFVDAHLQAVNLYCAEMQGATFERARMDGAALHYGQLQGATLDDALLTGADLTGALVWRTRLKSLDSNSMSLTHVRANNIDWEANVMNSCQDKKPWSKSNYNELVRNLYNSIPEGETQKSALKRIEVLDCKQANGRNDCTTDPTRQLQEWRPQIEAADKDLTDQVYTATLSKILETIICDGGLNAIHILRGLMISGDSLSESRLFATFENAPKLIDDIQRPSCPVSAELTREDKSRLLEIKQEAEKRFHAKPEPAEPAKAR